MELVYYANPGTMKGLLISGNSATLWDTSNSKENLCYTLLSVEFEGGWSDTYTQISFDIIGDALKLRLVPRLNTYITLVRVLQIDDGF